jgi:hypothetical protein
MVSLLEQEERNAMNERINLAKKERRGGRNKVIRPDDTASLDCNADDYDSCIFKFCLKV